MLKFSNEHDQMSCKIPVNVLFTHGNAPDQTHRIKRFNKTSNKNFIYRPNKQLFEYRNYEKGDGMNGEPDARRKLELEKRPKIGWKQVPTI